jgi:GINS complex subunit 2
VLQVEFVAEDEIVEIVPNIRMDALNMICVRLPPPSLSTPHPPPILTSRAAAVAAVQGDFGPFFPQIPARVPLWLAVALKKRSKCTIRTPDWMTVGQCFLVACPPFIPAQAYTAISICCLLLFLLDRLTQVLEAERESPREFQPLPFHYIEISKLLFDQ